MSQLGRIMNQRARDAAKSADVVVFVTDVPSDKPKGDKAKGEKPKGKEEAREPRPLTPHRGDVALLADIGAELPTILVVNKIDRMRQKGRLLPLLEGLGKIRSFAATVPISALREDGVERVLSEVAKLLPEGEPRFDEDDLTDRPTRFFAAEYVREQILRATSEEVPHAAAVAIDRFTEPPQGMVFIDATIHVERPGQRKIMIGDGGEMLKRIGTNARLRIEELMGRRVTLKLWVRVTPGWRESIAQLDELGYGRDDGAKE
jgi:GTP-binding protein Era